MATVADLQKSVADLSTNLANLDAREAGEVSIDPALLDSTVAAVDAANVHINSLDAPSA